MTISGSFSLPGIMTSGTDSVATKQLEDATKARRAFELTEREKEKSTPANSAETKNYATKTSETLFNAQSIAQQFKDFMDKSPEELMREQIIRELGYTEEELAGMTPEDRAKAEAKILEAIKIKIEMALKEKGVDVEIGAPPKNELTAA